MKMNVRLCVISIALVMPLHAMAECQPPAICANGNSVEQARALDDAHIPLVTKDLQLYTLLRQMQDRLKTLYPAGVLRKDGSLLIKIKLVVLAITLMEQIVSALNNGCFANNPEIEYRFVNMCNTLNMTQPAEPYQLRLQKYEVQDFNQYLIRYCINPKDYADQTSLFTVNPSDYLSKDDRVLVDKMVTLNYILVSGLLRRDYIDADWLDLFIDWFYHLPTEFVCEHAMIFVGLGVLMASAGGYFIYRTLA